MTIVKRRLVLSVSLKLHYNSCIMAENVRQKREMKKPSTPAFHIKDFFFLGVQQTKLLFSDKTEGCTHKSRHLSIRHSN